MRGYRPARCSLCGLVARTRPSTIGPVCKACAKASEQWRLEDYLAALRQGWQTPGGLWPDAAGEEGLAKAPNGRPSAIRDERRVGRAGPGKGADSKRGLRVGTAGRIVVVTGQDVECD